jgi:carbamoyltransferase
MKILGINMLHPDASACLVVNGVVVRAIAEERLGQRIKHASGYPVEAIKWVLNVENIDLGDLDYIAISHNPKANILQKFRSLILDPVKGISKLTKFSSKVSRGGEFLDFLHENINYNDRFSGEVVKVEHHIAHAASAYLMDGSCRPKLSYTYDGSGDFVSVMVAHCDENGIHPIVKSYVPNSFGFFYTSLCQFIGFTNFGEEYKVMGLAPYGNPLYLDQMQEIMTLSSKKMPALNDYYFDFKNGLMNTSVSDKISIGTLYSDNIYELFDLEREQLKKNSQLSMDIARSTQAHFERTVCESVGYYMEETGFKDLTMAGGCALNGVTNALIERTLKPNSVCLQPAASDDGTAIGAALYCARYICGKQLPQYPMPTVYLGGEFSKEDILKELKRPTIGFIEFANEDELLGSAAADIEAGHVVGWFQGRSEFGPRALGNRSILANPLIKNMKDIINKKIKKRESFRPFAPSVLKENMKDYFSLDIESPYMMHVIKFAEDYHNTFPAVTHADLTGRVQTVSKATNQKYYRLISKFKELTGFGILLNTSFNENEPIVETPAQAIDCFLRTDMDSMYINNFKITKKI